MAMPEARGLTDQALFSDDVIAERFACLETYASLVLAVSGGADSMALMHLVARWVALRGHAAPDVVVVTVDHGLRPGSDQEACHVARSARTLNFSHRTETWLGPKPTTGLQSAARNARYGLLLDAIDTLALSLPVAVVTAHTIDDQAETVTMRLARGSGIDGLGAMHPERKLRGRGQAISLVRPLLDVAKSDLVSYLSAHGHDWIEDPSNRSHEFERVRVRRALENLNASGVSAPALARTADRARRASQALQQFCNAFIETCVATHGGAFAKLAVQDFDGQPDEVQIRVLRRLIDAFGGGSERPDLQQVESLQARLMEEPVITTTLGGCVVDKSATDIVVYRELGRDALPTLTLRPGKNATWDGRFRVTMSDSASDPDDVVVRVQALDKATLGELRSEIGDQLQKMPVAAALTLPSFWQHEQLLAVPTLFRDPSTLPGTKASPGLSPNTLDVVSTSTRPSVNETGHGVCRDRCKAVFVGFHDDKYEA